MVSIAEALVMQGTATAINCYSCSAGTEGCGVSSFSKTGAGVTTMSMSTYTACMVGALLRCDFSEIYSLENHIFRKHELCHAWSL